MAVAPRAEDERLALAVSRLEVAEPRAVLEALEIPLPLLPRPVLEPQAAFLPSAPSAPGPARLAGRWS